MGENSENIKKSFRFTQMGRNLLIELVNEFKVIEDKSLGSLMLSKKANAWEKITARFNASTDSRRVYNTANLKVKNYFYIKLPII